MVRLFAVIYVLCFTVLVGGAVTAVLAAKLASATNISLAALAGALVALPVAWIVARMINEAVNTKRA